MDPRDQQTYAIIGAAFEVQKQLRYGSWKPAIKKRSPSSSRSGQCLVRKRFMRSNHPPGPERQSIRIRNLRIQRNLRTGDC
jgi:hypothetical protein